KRHEMGVGKEGVAVGMEVSRGGSQWPHQNPYQRRGAGGDDAKRERREEEEGREEGEGGAAASTHFGREMEQVGMGSGDGEKQIE
ncbi:hypothetical protein KI387_037232, partial [Taxus chinensis]